jgi:endonuclease/exonuclease/phosphatase (EEP) superfamily protein YafD
LVALLLRRWRLAAIAGVVIACHVTWIAPDFFPRELGASTPSDAAGETGDASGLRLYYQNVNMHADDYERRIATILAAEPDVIALVEFVPQWEAAVNKSEIFTKYPHNTLREKPKSQQLVLFSKLPLKDVAYRFIAGRRLAVAGTLEVSSRPLRLFCLHAPRPLIAQAEQYRAFGQEATSWIRQTQGPCIVVGDFNATQHSAMYQRLTDAAELHSAHRDVGRGFAVSWPSSTRLEQGRFLLPPIRIDHVLLSPELECIRIDEGDSGLSDHKPLVCDVRLAPMGGEEEDGEVAAE